jgi:diketogulonate reductase-like aldo/keto reductase
MTFGTVTPDGRALVLADGYQIPMLGLGVWQIFDFTLSGEDMARLDALDQTKGTGCALERSWW